VSTALENVSHEQDIQMHTEQWIILHEYSCWVKCGLYLTTVCKQRLQFTLHGLLHCYLILHSTHCWK